MLPVFVWGWHFIERTLHSPALVLLWAVVAFFVPVAFSTMDFKYARERRRELGVGLFHPLVSGQDFTELYIPAWIRMGVMGLSALFSLLILDRLGVTL